MNLLLVGGSPPPVGGTTILFQQLADDLRAQGAFQIRVINISRIHINFFSNMLHALRCLLLLFRYLPWASVLSFQASVKGAVLFGPFVHLTTRLFRKQWIFRGFGGDIDTWHRQAGLFARRVFDSTVLHADILLLERKSTVEYFKTRTASVVEWFPNSRHRLGDISSLPGATSQFRFVFVGHVKPAKGIGEIIAAAKMLLVTRVTVDVYGPLQEGVSDSWFNDSPVRYRGLLPEDEVVRTMGNYDALLLPTYWEGEGHPGVILEAYCAGIPVIATRWGGIPEIVTSETGILVEPRDVEGLARAMQQIMTSEELRARLRAGARQKATEFDAEQWTTYFIQLCEGLTAGRRG